MWSGTIDNIPAGWAICDGTQTTPDLRDRFVVGAGTTYAIGDTGGSTIKDLSHTHGPGTLNTDNDTHDHDVDSGNTGSESSHTHDVGSYSTDNDTHNHTLTQNAPVIAQAPSGATYDDSTDNDTHNHSVTGTSGSGSSHNHSSGTLNTDNDTHDHDV